jgi:exodeoxyribonuclease VII large subunit
MTSHDNKLTLLQLNGLVKQVVETTMKGPYWVEAELSGINERGGHCYMELIEKDPGNNTPVAKASAICWRNKWFLVKNHFQRETGKVLAVGMKVLLMVTPQFHESFGFSWMVADIDPAFTMGDMLLKRQRIIAQLKAEGMFDANRELTLPLFAQRIAVISSETAAGYGDFCNHLAENEYHYAFKTTLFAAVMQGELVEQTIIEALNAINQRYEEFDCVVITRGGGATSDLSGFDTYNLACNVVNFPLPVITAIGHDRDESVLDMVSNVRVKTPTAAAAFFIDRLHQVDRRIDNAGQRIANIVAARMERENMRVKHLAVRIPTLFAVVRTVQNSKLDALMQRAANALYAKVERERNGMERREERMENTAKYAINNEQHRLQILEQRMEAVNPFRILEKGYSITWKDGKAVRSASELKPGDNIVTRLYEGSITSTICLPCRKKTLLLHPQ